MSADILTTAEAAERLKVSESYLRQRRVSGDGPAFVQLGRSVRYRAADLEAWVNTRTRGSTSECAGAST